MLCETCGGDFKRMDLHRCKSDGGVAVVNPVEPVIRSERGRRRAQRDMQALSPLEQIRRRPTATNGPYAYYINPDGATIRDALILYPNGAKLSQEEDPRGKFSENADYYQARQARKGLEYVGPTLNEGGVRRLVEVLQRNREDEILDLEDQIVAVEHDITNSDRPDWRDNQRKRRAQLQKRLDTVRAGFDPDELIAELNQIAQAQQLSRVPPAVLSVMRQMIGALDNKVAEMATAMRSTASMPENDDYNGGRTRIED